MLPTPVEEWKETKVSFEISTKKQLPVRKNKNQNSKYKQENSLNK